jgi:PAS domain-containing protein
MIPPINTENHFRTLIMESPMATALYVGADMVIELANPAMLKIWQRDEQVIGKPLSIALPELQGQPFLDLLAQVYNTGTAYHAEAQKAELGTEGEMRPGYFNFTYKPLRKQSGDVYAILNTAIEITAQVQVTHQLEEDKERTDFILQSAGIGTWVVDLIAKTVDWDERCSQIFDIPNAHKIDYNKTLEYIFPADQTKVIRAVERAISPGSDGVYDIEYRTVGAVDKQVRWVRSRGRAYFNEAGLAYKFVGTVANITESVKLREARMQSELRASIALDAAGMGFWSVYALEDRVWLATPSDKAIAVTYLYTSRRHSANWCSTEKNSGR